MCAGWPARSFHHEAHRRAVTCARAAWRAGPDLRADRRRTGHGDRHPASHGCFVRRAEGKADRRLPTVWSPSAPGCLSGQSPPARVLGGRPKGAGGQQPCGATTASREVIARKVSFRSQSDAAAKTRGMLMIHQLLNTGRRTCAFTPPRLRRYANRKKTLDNLAG